jgi:hypothetical protein
VLAIGLAYKTFFRGLKPQGLTLGCRS